MLEAKDLAGFVWMLALAGCVVDRHACSVNCNAGGAWGSETSQSSEYSINVSRSKNRRYDLAFSFPGDLRQCSGAGGRLGREMRCRLQLRSAESGWSVDEWIDLKCTMNDDCYSESRGGWGCLAKETWCSDVVAEGPGHENSKLVVLYSNVVLGSSNAVKDSLNEWRKAESMKSVGAAVVSDAAVVVQEVNGCIFVYIYQMHSGTGPTFDTGTHSKSCQR